MIIPAISQEESAKNAEPRIAQTGIGEKEGESPPEEIRHEKRNIDYVF
jgi:hypothetical protein